jgi:hypothetical protein
VRLLTAGFSGFLVYSGSISECLGRERRMAKHKKSERRKELDRRRKRRAERKKLQARGAGAAGV